MAEKHAEFLRLTGADQTLLAPVPHRQVVITLPKRLRAYCLYRRPLLGDLARVAARAAGSARRTRLSASLPPAPRRSR